MTPTITGLRAVLSYGPVPDTEAWSEDGTAVTFVTDVGQYREADGARTEGESIRLHVAAQRTHRPDSAGGDVFTVHVLECPDFRAAFTAERAAGHPRSRQDVLFCAHHKARAIWRAQQGTTTTTTEA